MPGLEGAAKGIGGVAGGAPKLDVGGALNGLPKGPEVSAGGALGAPSVPPEAPAQAAVAAGLERGAAADTNAAIKNLADFAGPMPEFLRKAGYGPQVQESIGGAVINAAPLEGKVQGVNGTVDGISTGIPAEVPTGQDPAASLAERAVPLNGNRTRIEVDDKGNLVKTEMNSLGVPVDSTPLGERPPERLPGQLETVGAQAEGKDLADKKAANKADREKRTQELDEKVKNDTATSDELKELRGLKQDPEQRRNELKQKASDGTITDQEVDELVKLNSKEDGKQLTPEQQLEKLQKDIDDLGTELMTKLANGETLTPEDYKKLEKLKELRGQETLVNQGFTPDQARAAIHEALHGKTGGNERQLQAVKEIQGKIQELMALEVQMLSIPKTVEALRDQRKQVQDAARGQHSKAESTTNEEQKLQEKGKEYSLYMQIANINAQIVQQKYIVPVLEAKRQDLEQYIRRKVGVTSGWGAVVEWGTAKSRNVATQVGVGVAEEMDYTFGIY